ncbi:MAG: hypothetical protein ACI3XA_01960 [Clostridia bacterium]
MKKSSMIFKVICLAVCFALSLSVIPVMAEEAVVEETVDEYVELVTEEAEEPATEAEEPDAVEESTEEPSEEVTEEVEVLDLFEATLRDGGVYVTPGEFNAAVFTCDNVRYKVPAGSGNLIKLDGFESGVTIHDSIAENEKNRIQAKGEITPEAAHSGYFGLSVKSGDVIYRTAVTEGDIYVFSAWLKMTGGSINDDDRAFKVVGGSGRDYTVGWNEVGRLTPAKGSWQQILFVFKAPETGLFQIDFNYKGSAALYMDDLELYDAEVFLNPLEIVSVECTQGGGNKFVPGQGIIEREPVPFDPKEGFTDTGYLTHKITVYNSDEDDVYYIALMVVYKNGQYYGSSKSRNCALVNDETEIVLTKYLNTDDDASMYSYMVYIFNESDYTQVYGKVPSRENPYIVYGH